MSVGNYRVIAEMSEWRDLAQQLGEGTGAIGFDLETGYTGPDRKKGAVKPHETAFIAGFSITDSTSWARYVPLRHDEGPNLDPGEAMAILAPLATSGRFVAHNAKFEARMLLTEGIEMALRSDTMLEAFLLSQWPEVGLKSLVKAVFGHEMAEITSLYPEDTKKKDLDALRFSTLPSDRPDVVAYACEDASWCLALHERHYEPAKSIAGGGLFTVDHAILDILVHMEERGLSVDWPGIEAAYAEGSRFVVLFEAYVRHGLDRMLKERHGETASLDALRNVKDKKRTTFNLNSSAQLATLFYDDEVGLGIPPIRFTNPKPPAEPKPSTDAIALNALSDKHEPVRLLLQLREVNNLVNRLSKWLNDYRLATDGKVHANYSQCQVASARFAAGDPAIQQVPKKWGWSIDVPEGTTSPDGLDLAGHHEWKGNFRSFIVASPGTYLMTYDYSQVELRVMAALAQERAWLDAFNNGVDIHSTTAALMLDLRVEDVDPDEHRPYGKTFNFALAYQMGVKSLADRLAVSAERAQELFDKFYANAPALSAWQSKVIREGKERGGTVSPFGRFAKIWELQSSNGGTVAKGERMLVNVPVQGGAADYMRVAMVRARKALTAKGWWGTKVWCTINLHDALTFEISDDLHPRDVLDVLVPAVEFPVSGFPVIRSDWEIGQDWGASAGFAHDAVTHESFRHDGEHWRLLSGEEEREPEPAAEEEIEALPAPPVLTAVPDPEPEEADDDPPGRLLVIDLPGMPTSESWQRFVLLARAVEGTNALQVRTPEGALDLPWTTGLTPAHAPKVAMALPGAKVFHPADSVDVDSMAMGLSL